MTRILLLGYDPETVDFFDPALPPGMRRERLRVYLRPWYFTPHGTLTVRWSMKRRRTCSSS